MQSIALFELIQLYVFVTPKCFLSLYSLEWHRLGALLLLSRTSFFFRALAARFSIEHAAHRDTAVLRCTQTITCTQTHTPPPPHTHTPTPNHTQV